ncbi:serine hydrolase domain-containing protein [Ktedonosporobacter rubrisoli]|nr:serine hydrolase domain-containing protein [Ktedonosporobacter rubrisoli]
MNLDLTTRLEAATKFIDRWLAHKLYIDRLPGLSVGIVYGDKILFKKGYGYANLEQQVKASETTCYRIASFSKIFTALAVMHLFEQGKLHLDDRVQQYLPWFSSEQAPQTAQITLRQLLTHTAGLDRDGVTPHWVDYRFPELQEIQRHIAEGGLSYTPATVWKYSNVGYTLLGEVVRAVSGLAYEEYVTEHVVKPLGMTHTAPVLTEAITQQLALGYSRNLPEQGREPFPHIETHVMASATGFSSNVVDLCQLIMAQFEGDTRLLRDETKREMRRIQWLRKEGDADWCLGFETWKVNQQRYYGHGGSFQGYRSRFGFDPERKVGVVVLVNAMDVRAGDLLQGALQIIDYVITHWDELAQDAVQSEHIEGYEGMFRSVWGDVASVTLNNSVNLFNLGAPNPLLGLSRLHHEGGHRFTMVDGNSIDHIGEPVSFVCDEQGVAQHLFVGPDPSERFELP